MTEQTTNNASLPCVNEKSEIQLEFTLSLPDGTVVEQTELGEAFTFKLGDGTFIDSLESLLIGLEEGTTAKLMLSPERAFGEADSANYQIMSRQDFPAEMDLEPGYVVGFNTPTGEEVPATVHEINGDEITVDFNHPLAGKTVQFEATIIKVLS